MPALQQEPVFSIPLAHVDFFTVDQFDQVYRVQFDQLRKVDEKGRSVFNYSNPLLGAIHSVSALDPLNLLLFYKDQAQITTLDNRLNESTALRLLEIDLMDVQLVSQSDQNHVWVYDQATDRLYRIGLDDAVISNKSLNLTQLVNVENHPVQLESTYDNVFLNVPEKGLLVFDATGALIHTIALKNVDYFNVNDRELFFLRQDTVRSVDFKRNRLTKRQWVVPDARFIAATSRNLYVADAKRLYQYRLNP